MVKATLTVLFLLAKMHHYEFCLIRFILNLINSNKLFAVIVIGSYKKVAVISIWIIAVMAYANIVQTELGIINSRKPFFTDWVRLA